MTKMAISWEEGNQEPTLTEDKEEEKEMTWTYSRLIEDM
jgi:hypothetical protein